MSLIVDIAMIGNEGYKVPALTTLVSMKKNKKSDSIYRVRFITDKDSNLADLKELESEDFQIDIIAIDIEKYKRYDYVNSNIRSATSVSLAKFELWQLITDSEKCLYLDCDLIIKEDLGKLFSTNLKGHPIAAVVDSGSIYYKHNYVKKCKNYFNSGVMLLDMNQLREINATEQLIECKRKLTDSLLMDQDAFNVVFDNKILALPVKYNFLLINLIRSTGNWTMDQINETYKTSYRSLNEICDDATIIHYASKDKPWLNVEKAIFKIWSDYYYDIAEYCPSFQGKQKVIKQEKGNSPLVSIIIPVFNTGKWLHRALDSVIDQTYKNIEIIIVDDGSKDDSIEIIRQYKDRDSRVQVFTQKNSGQSTARNRALIYSKGEYIYFFDSDDFIRKDTIEKLVNVAYKENLDLVLFAGGESYYENTELERQFPHYKAFYKKKNDYVGYYDGKELYPILVKNKDYNVSPCLQFIHRKLIEDNSIYFYENIIYEDNLFSLEILMRAKKVKVLRDEFFIRTVRSQSTMTSVKTEYSYVSHQKLMIALIEFLYQCRNFDQDTKVALYSQISYFIKSTLKKYSNTNLGNSYSIDFNTPSESILLLLLSRASTITKNKTSLQDTSIFSFVKKALSYFLGKNQALACKRNDINTSNEIKKIQASNNNSINLLQFAKSREFNAIKLKAPVGDNFFHKRIPIEAGFNVITVEMNGVSLASSSNTVSVGLLDIDKKKTVKIINCELETNIKFTINIDPENNSTKKYSFALYAGSHGKTSESSLSVDKLVIRYYIVK